MRVERSDLVSLIDELIAVDGGTRVAADADRPVLIVVGGGGSGRTTLLRTTWDRWAGRAPIAWVDPAHVDADDGPDAGGLRPVLAAVLLGLSSEVDGYRLRFPRVLAAHVAITQPPQPDPGRARADMRERLAHYRDRANLIDLVGGLVRIGGQAARAAQVPGGDVVAALGAEVAPRVADGVRHARWLTRWSWGAALEWFGHQDQNLRWEPVDALVHLAEQARVGLDAVRRDVDDLLVAALLADLRESLRGVVNRPANAVILLDNGDLPMAGAFVAALTRVRDRAGDALARQRALPPEPLAVITVSGGPLARDLAGAGGVVPYWSGAALDGRADYRRSRPWLPVRLADLTESEVTALAGQRMWPPEFGRSAVGRLVFRLTGGHARATGDVLRALSHDPTRLDELGKVLAPDGADPAGTLEARLLNDVVAGLRPNGVVDRLLREDLTTVAAARHEDEAATLGALLQSPSRHLLLTSTILWSATPRSLPPLDPPSGGPLTLPPLIRYLALRRLARRSGDAGPTWEETFTALRDAVAPDDIAGRLHHELALGGLTAVAAELAELLPSMPDRDWLLLLDRVTATPDPRSVIAVPRREPARSAQWSGVITRIVEGQHAAADPQLSDRAVLNYLYTRLSNDFGQLAEGSRALLTRATHYAALATQVG